MQRTRVVHWLRIILPLLALVILSTMFLFSGRGGEKSTIPFAEADAEKLAGDDLITSPEYSGVTSDGAELILRATEVSPGSSGGVASRLRLDVRNDNGQNAGLTAPDAEVNDNSITLRGGVEMTTSSGWLINANEIMAATDRSRLSADNGVDAVAPFGKITAGKMNVRPENPDAEGSDAVMNFTDGVRLIYSP